MAIYVQYIEPYERLYFRRFWYNKHKKPIDLLGNKKLNLVPMWAYSPAQMLMDHAKAGPNEQ